MAWGGGQSLDTFRSLAVVASGLPRLGVWNERENVSCAALVREGAHLFGRECQGVAFGRFLCESLARALFPETPEGRGSMKLPFFKFFPSDWLSDERLRTVSIEARGLWIDLVAFAWKAERKGYVELVRGTPLSNDAIARVVGGSVEQVVRLLAELEGACVFSREAETNVIFSRRIVDDVAALQRSSAAGKMGGGNPLLKGGHKGGYKAPSKPQKSEVRSQKSDKEGVASARPTLADWLAEAKARFPEWPTADAEAAWHHYEGNGWRTGKNPVRRWQSCVVTCHARWAKYPRSTPRPEPVQRYLPANLRPGANDE